MVKSWTYNAPQDLLNKIVEDATVDCYDEYEQICGFFALIEEVLAVPFAVTVLGQEVSVEAIEQNDADEIVALCALGDYRQRIPLVDLPTPSPLPDGWESVEAYRYWVRGEQ